MAFDPAIRFSRGVVPVLSTLPNAVDILTVSSDGTHIDIVMQPNMMAP